MLSKPLLLNRVDATDIIEFLYHFFERDFIHDDVYLANKIYVDPRCNLKDDGKELTFWHLTTKEEKEKIWIDNKLIYKVIGRYTDYERASRLEWIKQILINFNNDRIKLFYHKETNKKRNIRLYLWAYEDDFVVILQKLGKSSSFLVTCFYINKKNQNKRNTFENRYQTYISDNNNLKNCEWF